MKSKFVKTCKNCNKPMYGYNLPDFCCSVCEYNFYHGLKGGDLDE